MMNSAVSPEECEESGPSKMFRFSKPKTNILEEL